MATNPTEYKQEGIKERISKSVAVNTPVIAGRIISIVLFGFVRVVRLILTTIKEAIRGY